MGAGAGSAGGYEAVRSLMADEAFCALRRRADRGLLLWPDLEDLPMPEGYTREQAWDLLTLVRRQTAIDLPWDSFVEKVSSGKAWYTNTRALADALSYVESRTSDVSDLGRAVAQHRGVDVVESWVRRDVGAAFEMDGLAAAGGAEAAVGAPDPRLAALAANFYRLLGESESYAARPLTPRAVEDLQYGLRRGVETLRPEPPAYVVDMVRLDPSSRYTDPASTLRAICEIAEGEGKGATMAPPLRVIYLSWLFMAARPFPCWNGLVEILVRHICLQRLGRRALAAVPLLRLHLDWTLGRDKVHRSYAEFMGEVEHYRNDYTPFFLLSLGLMSDGVAAVEAAMAQLARRDAELDERLADARVNHRQRAIILNAINDPAFPQRIEAHRRRYRVAYATARKDFLDLAEAGYLRQEVEGRAFVFYPGRLLGG